MAKCENDIRENPCMLNNVGSLRNCQCSAQRDTERKTVRGGFYQNPFPFCTFWLYWIPSKRIPLPFTFFACSQKKIMFNVTRTWQKIIWQTAATLDYNCENFKCKKFFLHLFTSWNICTSNIAFNVYERKYFDFWINFYTFDLWHVNLYPMMIEVCPTIRISWLCHF
jgi:hypothetical protein